MDNQNSLCTFYIVRHGQTEWNVKGLIQGHADSPLTEEGIKQATDLSGKLSSTNFDLVFSSDLLRAKRTAEIITLDRQLTVQTTALLRERGWGKLDGSPNEKIKELYDQVSEERQKEAEIEHEIEAEEKVIERLVTFLRETSVAYPGKTVLVVTHGGIMSRFLDHIGFWDFKERPKDAISNGAVVVIESDGVEFFVKSSQGIAK